LAAVARADIGSGDAAADAGADAAAELPLPVDALAACEAAALDGEAAPPPVQADATIANIASGAATRRNECFVVKLDLLWVVMTLLPRDSGGRTRADTDAILTPPTAIARVVTAVREPSAPGRSRAFHRRRERASRV